MKTLLKIPLFLIGDILYLLSLIIPRRKNLWIFGAWFGERYSDNSRALFEYVNNNHPEIEAVWLARKRNVVELVRKHGHKAELIYSAAGIWTNLRAKVGVMSNDIRDVNPVIKGKTYFIQLWHGTPLKKIIHDDKITFKEPSFLKRTLFPFTRLEYSKQMFIAPSDSVARIFSGAFGVPFENIKITGYPRNDFLYRQKSVRLPLFSTVEELKKTKKVGIYLPTFRMEGGSDFDEYPQSELLKIDFQFGEKNLFLLVKSHFVHRPRDNQPLTELSNIKFISDNDIEDDLYSLLPITDFLITDYSSVYFDYLLLDKPIIFFSYDIENYRKSDRGFYFDYDKTTPGPKVYRWEDLADTVAQSLENPGKFAGERLVVSKKLNHFRGGDSSARVFDEIREFISKDS